MTQPVSVITKARTALINQLIDKLITTVDSSDNSQAGYIAEGPLQASPFDSQVTLEIRHATEAHPFKIDDDSGEAKSKTFYREMGSPFSTMRWKRYFVIDVKIALENLAKQDVVSACDLVYSRMQHAIHTTDISGIDDEFGESIADTFVVDGGWMEIGGGDGSWQYTGEMLVSFTTHLDPVV